MPLFFWQFFEHINPVTSTLLIVLNFLLLIFCLVVLIRLLKFAKQAIFQIFALSLSFFGLFVLFGFRFFQWDYQLGQICSFIQILLYSFFCYSFGTMYFKLSSSTLIKRRYLTGLIIFSMGLLTILLIMAYNNIVSKGCEIIGLEFTVISLGIQAFYSIPTIYFGIKIKKILKNKFINIKPQQSNSPHSYDEKLLNNSQYNHQFQDLWVLERQIQIKFVLIGYGISLITSTIVVLMMSLLLSNCIKCLNVGNSNIMAGKNIYGDILILLKGTAETIPFIIIPFGLYLTPTKARINSESVQFKDSINVTLQQDQSEINNENIKDKIKNLALNKKNKNITLTNISMKSQNINQQFSQLNYNYIL